MLRKITKRTVDQQAPTDRDYTVWDTDVKGFGVRVRKRGSKFYVLKMRIGGQQRWITIGRHGSPWTPETARREALRLLGEKAAGNDPASQRDNRKGVITIKELGERFLADYVPEHCKESTAREYRRAVELFINPVLGQYRISDVVRADVGRFHHGLRDKPYQANRALGVLSKMLNLAEQWGLRPDGSNPCRHVAKYREVKRQRYLSQEELQKLGQVLNDIEEEGSESPFVVAAIRLLIFTGARLSEVLTLKWDHVDLDHTALRLPDSKTGAKLIYLNPPAVDLLTTLPRMRGNPYVIAGDKHRSHRVNLQGPWRRIRARAKMNDVRIHDLRHSFASVAAGAGLSLPIIGTLLGHTQPATTARYAHLAMDPARNASALVGDTINDLMNKRPSKPNK